MLEDLRDRVAARRVVIFVGAGVSSGASKSPLAGWKGFLLDGVARCDATFGSSLPPGWAQRQRDALEQGDLDEWLNVAEAISRKLDAPRGGEFRRWLRETVAQLEAKQRGAIEAIDALGASLVTTNYDDLLRNVTGRNAITWRHEHHVSRFIEEGQLRDILHVHGHWSDSESIVLGVRSYDRIVGHEHAQSTLRTLLMTYTAVFIGYGEGLGDPNFGALRTWAASVLRGAEHRHYRLCLASEEPKLRADHKGERIFPLVYGDSHDQLERFLHSLVAKPGTALRSPSKAPGAALSGPEASVFQCAPTLGTRTFVGREREIQEIESMLVRAEDVQLRAALDGLPGIGKTELARQVVTRLANAKRFRGGIFWFDAEHTDLRLQWAKIAEDANGPALPDLDARARWAVRHIEQRAQQGEAILIVLDNVESWSPPPGPLPDLSAIRMLVTTRARWLHNSFQPYEVPPLELEDARRLLNAIVGSVLVDADELLRALGGHVLSIELAATYLRECGVSPNEYRAQLAAGKSPNSSVADQTAYRATAESAFRLLWLRIAPELRGAWVVAAQLPPTWFSTNLADAVGLDSERRRGLVRFHILDRDEHRRHRMHRLLVEFALGEGPPERSIQEAVIRGATALLETGDAGLTFQRYRQDSDTFVHLLAASANTHDGARLRTACALGLRQLGELTTARELLEQALAFYLRTHDGNHPAVSTVRNDLALVLRDLWQLPTARELLEQALSSDLMTYGNDHPAVATRRANLALVLRDLGELPAARELSEQALASDVRTYGDDHPTVATRRTNLGLVLKDLEELSTARELFEQALASGLKTYGDEHPAVARDRNNLALVLRDLYQLPAARKLLEQALASGLKNYSDDHPVVANRRSNLASVLKDLGELPTARDLYEQALASDLKTYGNDHPKVTRHRTSLALVLRGLGDLQAARELFQRALESDLRIRGDDHPVVANRRRMLGVLHQELRELPAAREMLQQALAADLRNYNSEHPQIARQRTNLALVLRGLGELPAARELLEQALASYIAAHGDRHATVASVRAHLATLLEEVRTSHSPTAEVLPETKATPLLKASPQSKASPRSKVSPQATASLRPKKRRPRRG